MVQSYMALNSLLQRFPLSSASRGDLWDSCADSEFNKFKKFYWKQLSIMNKKLTVLFKKFNWLGYKLLEDTNNLKLLIKGIPASIKFISQEKHIKESPLIYLLMINS
jgi:hypothetical protein